MGGRRREGDRRYGQWVPQCQVLEYLETCGDINSVQYYSYTNSVSLIVKFVGPCLGLTIASRSVVFDQGEGTGKRKSMLQRFLLIVQ